MPPMRLRRLGLAALALLALMTLLPLGGCLARRMVYPAPDARVPDAPPPPLEAFVLPLRSGGTAHGWAWMPPGAPGPSLLFFHGNAENLETMRRAGTLDRLRDLGLPFAVLDYPGYGQSRGTPSEQALADAAAAGVDWLESRRPGAGVVVAGWSLGAAVAVQAAALRPRQTAGLVLLSPWASLPEAARLHVPGWLVAVLLRERYPSAEAVAALSLPALVIHGADDDLIPPAQGRQVAAALTARFVAVPECGHNDLLGRPETWTEIRDFLKTRPRRP